MRGFYNFNLNNYNFYKLNTLIDMFNTRKAMLVITSN